MNNGIALIKEMSEKYEGEVFKTKNFGDCVVLKYNNHSDIEVKFLNSGAIKSVRGQALRNGSVKDRMQPTVYGVGIVGDQPISKDGKHFLSYCSWSGMIERCYDKNKHKTQKYYIGCSVSENFKFYTYFDEWCKMSKGFGLVDTNGRSFELDKDILVLDNKVYSEDTCCFVPSEINSIFTNINFCKRKGDRLIGTYVNRNGKFSARINIEGRLKHVGVYDTREEAFLAYKKEKLQKIYDVANKWRDCVDERIYDKMMTYDF